MVGINNKNISGIFNHKIIAIFLNVLIFGLVSCGGGSSSDPAPPPEPRTITGVVNAPGGTAPRLTARMVSNVTVELYEIDNSGNPIGAALGSSTTNANGEFSITIANDLQLSANLVVRAVINGSETINAIVTGTQVDITPSSQYVFEQIINDPDVVLSSLPLSNIQGVVDYIDSQAIDLDSQADLSSALALIASSAGAEVGNQLEAFILTAGTWDTSTWDNARYQ
jgi:hypothetical protein